MGVWRLFPEVSRYFQGYFRNVTETIRTCQGISEKFSGVQGVFHESFERFQEDRYRYIFLGFSEVSDGFNCVQRRVWKWFLEVAGTQGAFKEVQ